MPRLVEEMWEKYLQREEQVDKMVGLAPEG